MESSYNMTLIRQLLIFLLYFSYVASMNTKTRSEMSETVKEMFLHAYESYMKNAYPADELMPLNCKGRYRDMEPSRGDVDDVLGNFSMTLIDSLDSLVIFGEIEKFDEAVRLVIADVNFDNDIVVSTFETNIRVLGGLLGGHVAANVLKNKGFGLSWYQDELLDMARDIGDRLLPAFNTTTGIPYPKVNLKYGVIDPRSRTGSESSTCTACAGTMIMEFGALSRLTGVDKYETAAHRAMKALWTYRSRSSNLVGTVINIHNGDWLRRDSGVGAGIDSYYEYCLKAYILLGEEDYLLRFNQHYKAVMQYINRNSLFLNVHMNNPNKRSLSYMDSLQAFWPGLQVLKGDIKSAIELHEVFYSVAKRHTFLPEAFTTNFEIHWGQHFLRPELVESTYFLYEATKDPYYLEVGQNIVENLNKYARVPCGFAAVKDVRTMTHENRMDSFLLSETLKYLYLLFMDKKDLLIDLHDFVFTTEAHLLPLALSNWNSSSIQNNVYDSENLHDRSCPRSTSRDGSILNLAEEIRRRIRNSNSADSCPRSKEKQSFVLLRKEKKAPLLRAEHFIPGNKDHILILKAMGISVSKTADGKVQLMQDSNLADNNEMAAEGITFMQSMIELAKSRNSDPEYFSRIVQLLSPPYNGNIVVNAGPAQFGLNLSKMGMGVSADVILADPFTGCEDLKNEDAANRRIVVMQRGDCMFVDKARVAGKHGAVGVIIIDNNEGSSFESQPMFAMSGDGGSKDVNIPAVFLFYNEGQVLQKAMQVAQINTQGYLRVRLADKALKKDFQKESVEGVSSEQQDIQDGNGHMINDVEKDKNRELHSQTFKKTEKNVDKIVELIKKFVNQPGLSFSAIQPTKVSSGLVGETADQREQWLYDVMMENFGGKKEVGESANKDVHEVVGKIENGVFSVKVKKIINSENILSTKVSNEKNTCIHDKQREFLNIIFHRDDDVNDSEIIVVGKVDNVKNDDGSHFYDITSLRLDERQTPSLTNEKKVNDLLDVNDERLEGDDSAATKYDNKIVSGIFVKNEVITNKENVDDQQNDNVHHPSDDINSTESVAYFTDDVVRSSVDVVSSSDDVNHLTDDVSPSDEVDHPLQDVVQLTDDFVSPSDDVVHLTDDVDHPSDDVVNSSDDLVHLADDVSNPANDVSNPADDVSNPADDAVFHSDDYNNDYDKGSDKVNKQKYTSPNTMSLKDGIAEKITSQQLETLTEIKASLASTNINKKMTDDRTSSVVNKKEDISEQEVSGAHE